MFFTEDRNVVDRSSHIVKGCGPSTPSAQSPKLDVPNSNALGCDYFGQVRHERVVPWFGPESAVDENDDRQLLVRGVRRTATFRQAKPANLSWVVAVPVP
jgi:hypothetical protein